MPTPKKSSPMTSKPKYAMRSGSPHAKQRHGRRVQEAVAKTKRANFPKGGRA